MRLDKYLKVSRLIKRRTVANEVADAGRILINGKIAKASQAVKAGDIIEVTFGNRPIKVKVLSDVEPRTKDVAREMYEIIAEGESSLKMRMWSAIVMENLWNRRSRSCGTLIPLFRNDGENTLS